MADDGFDPSADASSANREAQSDSGWKKSRAAGGLRAAGKSLSQSGRDELNDASRMAPTPVAYHRGGKIRKTGLKRLEKGERVIAKGKTKRVEKMMRKAKMRMKARG